MTMANEPADDDALVDDIFGSDREGRGGKEPASDSESDAPLRDERGRFATKSEDEPKPDETVEEAVSEESAEPAVDAETKHHVPLSELKAERKRRQEIERKQIEAEARAKVLEDTLSQLRSQPQQNVQQPHHQPQFEVPDPMMDPQGYIDFQMRQIQQSQRMEMLDIYEERVRERFGSAAVDTAFQAAQQAGVLNAIKQTRDPWSTLMKWHKENVVRQEIGDDLESFKKRIADEAVQKALAGLKAGNSAGATQQRFPGSLAAATATGNQGATLTDEAIANDVFGSDRRQRPRSA